MRRSEAPLTEQRIDFKHQCTLLYVCDDRVSRRLIVLRNVLFNI
jgi:hypothetical protein